MKIWNCGFCGQPFSEDDIHINGDCEKRILDSKKEEPQIIRDMQALWEQMKDEPSYRIQPCIIHPKAYEEMKVNGDYCCPACGTPAKYHL